MSKKRPVADYREQIGILIELVAEMPHGPPKTALIDQCVRIADSHNDEFAGYHRRMDLIEAATFGGQAEMIFPAFSWCLALADRKPEEYGGFQILWRYKWIINEAVNFPTISLERLEAMLEDLRLRYHSYGSNEHPYWQTRRGLFESVGRIDTMDESNSRLRKFKPDQLSNCKACEVQAQVRIALLKGKNADALKRADRILRGELSCATIPQNTHASLLTPLCALDRYDDAMSYHRESYPKVDRRSGFLGALSDHLIFLTITGNLKEAAKSLERALPIALSSFIPASRFSMFNASAFFCEQSNGTLRLKLPLDFPLYNEANKYEAAALGEWFDHEARAMAEAFDARNGNRFYSASLEQRSQWADLSYPVPLPERKPKRKKV